MELETIEIGIIQQNNFAIRLMDDEIYLKLKNSITHHGMMAPIIVRSLCIESFEIIDGGFRFRAFKELFPALKIPCIVLHGIDREQAITRHIIANDLRFDFEAHSLIELINELQKEVGNSHLVNVLPYSMSKLKEWEMLYDFDFSIYEEKKSTNQIGMFK